MSNDANESAKVLVVVNCARNKSAKFPAKLRIQDVCPPSSDETVQERVQKWIEKRESFKDDEDEQPGCHLYRGDHWQQCMEFKKKKIGGGHTLELWVASAGYGLVKFDCKMVSYGATFSPYALDSVVRSDADGGLDKGRQDWWNGLSEGAKKSRPNDPTTIFELVEMNRSSPLLVVASGSYVRAMAKDLLKAFAGEDETANQRSIISTAKIPTELERYQVKGDVKLQRAPDGGVSILGGARVALNARLAGRLIDDSRKHGFDRQKMKQLVDELVKKAPQVEPIKRQPFKDDCDVKKYIEKQLAKDPSMSKSPMLAHLRKEGKACEQKRFGKLYSQVKKEK